MRSTSSQEERRDDDRRIGDKERHASFHHSLLGEDGRAAKTAVFDSMRCASCCIASQAVSRRRAADRNWPTAAAGTRRPDRPAQSHATARRSYPAMSVFGHAGVREDRGRNGIRSMRSLLWYLLAAMGEIAGCFAFWAWLRLGKSPLWTLPGIAFLVVFALALTRVDTAAAGRAYAAYGGVYIFSSLLWLWTVENTRPDRWGCDRRRHLPSSGFGHSIRSARCLRSM